MYHKELNKYPDDYDLSSNENTQYNYWKVKSKVEFETNIRNTKYQPTRHGVISKKESK